MRVLLLAVSLAALGFYFFLRPNRPFEDSKQLAINKSVELTPGAQPNVNPVTESKPSVTTISHEEPMRSPEVEPISKTINDSNEVTDLNEVPQFLNRAALKESKPQVDTYDVVRDDRFLRDFRGIFEGKATSTSDNVRFAPMYLEMNIEVVNERQQGRIYVEMARPGQGLLLNLPIRISELRRKAGALWITVESAAGSPRSDTVYYQVYTLRELDAVAGNVYRLRRGELRNTETFVLQRKN
ncbi:MAG TPA: hypothetical protein PLH57_01820 [Oligoflexia bacterium]|nr:hypothetical protein [Oligoflexia bacterium]